VDQHAATGGRTEDAQLACVVGPDDGRFANAGPFGGLAYREELGEVDDGSGDGRLMVGAGGLCGASLSHLVAPFVQRAKDVYVLHSPPTVAPRGPNRTLTVLPRCRVPTPGLRGVRSRERTAFCKMRFVRCCPGNGRVPDLGAANLTWLDRSVVCYADDPTTGRQAMQRRWQSTSIDGDRTAHFCNLGKWARKVFAPPFLGAHIDQ